jgi:superfamily II DNA/RNA helicase
MEIFFQTPVFRKQPYMKSGSPLFDKCLAARGITGATDIQKKVTPLIAGGKSVIFRSATGTGKTFAYLIPLLERLLETGGGRPAMMICAPTHELCAQIKREADFLIKGIEHPETGRKNFFPPALLLAGSGNIGRQKEALKKNRPSVVVGNPGRIITLARTGKLRLSGIRFFVLDEGDRLTADELFEETAELAGMLGPGVQAAACSATLSAKSRERLVSLLGGKDAEESGGLLVVETDEREILRERIQHWAFFSERRRKIDTLISFLRAAKPKKALVISGGGGQPGIIFSRLKRAGAGAGALYGGLDKRERKAAMDGFRYGKIPVLVSSDLAARGLDVPDITHVIELDVPESGGAYVHRAGRTGRAGKRGVMVTIGDEKEMRRLERIEKQLGLTVYPKILYRGRVAVPGTEETEPSGKRS